MSLTMNIEFNFIDLLHKAGVEAQRIYVAKLYDMTCHVDHGGLIVSCKVDNTDYSYTCDIKLGVISLLASGSISSHSTPVIKSKLAMAVDSLMKMVTDIPETAKVFEEPVKVPEEPVEYSAKPVIQAPLAKVKLSEATALLQPVAGTDTGSTYYVVALSSGLKVAARYIEHSCKLSVRVEGSELLKFAKNLADTGFNSSGTWFSVHVQAADVVLIRKTLGSLLYGIGVEFDQQIKNFDKLKAA